MDHARYAALFATEAREHLAELDATLLQLEALPDRTHVATLFRSMHTIKGMAGAMGYSAVEQLSHALESLLDRVRASEIVPQRAEIDLLFDGTSLLRAAVDAVVSEAVVSERDAASTPDEIDRALAPLLQRLSEWHNREPTNVPALDGVAPIDPLTGLLQIPVASQVARIADIATDLSTYAVQIRLVADCPLKGVRAMLVTARVEALGTVRDVQPPQAMWHDDRFDGAFVVTLRTSRSALEIESATRSAGDVDRVIITDVGRQAAAPAAMTTRASDANGTVRIDRRCLDTLLDLVGELVIARDRLVPMAETADQSSTRALSKVAHETARLISALQDEVLQARMVPISQVFDRFPRVVRDVARELGKDVQFLTEGREIELDRSLLDAIADPLVHLLRNALDHGIEDATARRAAGKSAVGTLTLRAVRDRAAVVLQVEDDGRGIDRVAILERARTHGLVGDEIQSLDDAALLEILAHPGFSTASAVTSISGRGVGVDVVSTRVRALGGVLELETVTGEGSLFSLRLPVTLAIARALVVQVADERYALPTAHVVEALEFDERMLVQGGTREAVTLRDDGVPLIHLRERFGHQRQVDDSYLVIVEVAARRIALLVDALIAQQDIVVKPFQVVRGSAPWFSGATVLGDGTPALIVDLGSLT
ncbi:MAG: chemotaxis protein CheA [Gemmatimonadaceae bacterium]|nr:chemotaxis protein CheA [Gemmatimonadaceae bacterium]